MAGLIRHEDIAAVRDTIRIEDIVSEYVTLKSGGVGSMMGLCPFHDERTPSFHVRPSMGLWHCFGCGEGGDVITFVQKINHLSFAEAVEFLAQKAGVTLHYEEGGRHIHTEEPGKRQRLLDAHRSAEDFYRDQLKSPEARKGRAFLAQRAFTQEMAAHFGVGYSPKEWDSLTRYLRGCGFTDKEIKISGLASEGKRGLYDRFRGRLMWPIRDITGATVGFGARRLDDDEESPKYLNTPETPIYHKSRVLYGLDLAKRDISRQRRIVIVEGYTDVMAAHVAGETTAVATCGTAFGEDHVRMVRRLISDIADPAAGVVLASGSAHGAEVIFTFDGDAAGRKAALRAFREDQHFASQTFVAVEPTGLDPCDLRLKRGDHAVLDLLRSRRPLFEFVIRSVLEQVDLAIPEGRVTALRGAAPVVAGIKDAALRREYTRSLAGWLGMEIGEVASAVRYARSHPVRHEDGRRDQSPSRNTRAFNQSENYDGGSYVSQRQGMVSDSKESMFSSISDDPPANIRVRHMPEDPVQRIERQSLEVVLQRPFDVIGSGFELLDGSSYTQPSLRAIHDAIRAIGGLDAFVSALDGAESQYGKGNTSIQSATRDFVENIQESAGEIFSSTITRLAVAPLPQDEQDGMRNYARGVMAGMVRMVLTRRIAEMRGVLQRMDPSDEGYEKTFLNLVKLEERRRTFSESERS